MFRGKIQVYLESVFKNELVALYISYLNEGPGSRENYHIIVLKYWLKFVPKAITRPDIRSDIRSDIRFGINFLIFKRFA